MATLRETFHDIAESIRAKGIEGTMTPLEMPQKIGEISSGTTKVVASGEVPEYRYYMLYGAKGTSDSLIEATTPFIESPIEEIDLSEVTSIQPYGCYIMATNNPNVRKFVFPTNTQVSGAYVCYRMAQGVSIGGDIDSRFNGAAATYQFSYMLRNAKNVGKVKLDFSGITGVISNNAFAYMLQGCEAEEIEIIFPSFESSTNTVNYLTQILHNCVNLKRLKIRGMIGLPVLLPLMNNVPMLESVEMPDLKWTYKASGSTQSSNSALMFGDGTRRPSDTVVPSLNLTSMTFPSLERIVGPTYVIYDGFFGNYSYHPNLRDIYLPKIRYIDSASLTFLCEHDNDVTVHCAASNQSTIQALSGWSKRFSDVGTYTLANGKPNFVFDL